MHNYFRGMAVSKENGCIEYVRHTNKDGYGYGRHKGKHVLTHRLSYCLSNDVTLESIKGAMVCHTCDNPPCLNPEHLFLGTAKDNTADSISKGRHTSFGHLARFTDDEIRSIRRSQLFQTTLAKQYKTTQSMISQIQRRKIYRLVKDNAAN